MEDRALGEMIYISLGVVSGLGVAIRKIRFLVLNFSLTS